MVIVNKIKPTVHVYAVLSMVFWGMSYLWSKTTFEYISPATTILLRLIISTIFLFAFLFLTHRLPKIKLSDLRLFFLSAFFNPFLYFLGESYGLDLVSPTVSAVIIATIPVFMPVIAFFFIQERLRPVNIAGLFISFAGVLLMIVDTNFSMTASPKGIILLFGAVASALIYGILLKKLTFKYSPVAIIALQNLIGVFYMFPVVLFLEGSNILRFQFESKLIISLLLLGILASSAAFVFFTKSVKHLGISKANIYTNLIPVFTAFFSYIVLGELIAAEKFFAITLVIAGVVLSQQKKQKSPTFGS